MPRHKSSKGSLKTSRSPYGLVQSPERSSLMLSDLLSDCSSSLFTLATLTSLLYIEHTRHAPQILHDLHSLSPSLLNTLLLAKFLTSFKFSLTHHFVMKPDRSIYNHNSLLSLQPSLPIPPSCLKCIIFQCTLTYL